MIADIIGTERVWEETRTIQGPFGRRTAMRGTRRLVDRHVVDPNEIKALPTGRLVMITKTPVAAVTRVQVRPLEHGPVGPSGGTQPIGAGRGRGDRVGRAELPGRPIAARRRRFFPPWSRPGRPGSSRLDRTQVAPIGRLRCRPDASRRAGRLPTRAGESLRRPRG